MSHGDKAMNTPAGGMTIGSIRPLNSRSDYPQWKFKTKMFLMHEELWYSIVGYPSTDTTSEEIRKFKDMKAMTKICLTLDGGAITHVRSCTTAREVWESLSRVYDDKGIGRKLSLERKLYRYHLSDFPSIEEYINAVLSTAQDLADIGKQIDDTSVAAILLGGLTQDFDPLVMAIENSNVEISTDLVKSKLLNESEKRASKESAMTSTASTSKNSGFASVKKIICYDCNQPGHKRPQCPLRKNKKSKKGESKPKNASTLLSALECSASLNKEDFYIDSGASTHLTCHKDWLSNYRNTNDYKEIILADNDRKLCSGVGDILLQDNNRSTIKSIKDVLYVPSLSTNLISVKKVVDKGITVVFNKKGCSLYKHNQVKISGHELGHATFCNGLYRLDNCEAKQQNENVLVSSAPSPDLWHRRLGHLCRIGLEELRKGKAIGVNYTSINNDPCIPCVEGKQFRKPFKPIKYKKSSIKLELIHSDLCGPFSTTSLEGNKYLLIFVDDLTRAVFCYFVKSKIEVRFKFVEFQTELERQTGLKIKRLRTDNGTEYVNSEFTSYLKSQGIVHETTVPHCPSSNGVAERTLRSIVEKARCMLQESGLPKTFWEEAIRTAVYLKNRCPHRFLNNSTPYEKWFNTKPDLKHLRVFGCRAYVHVPDCERRKLDPKAKPYIFVGYGPDNHSYRFRDPTNIRKVVKGRDVVFLEDCFSNTAVNDELNSQNIILTSDNLQVSDQSVPITEGRMVIDSRDDEPDSDEHSSEHEYEDAVIGDVEQPSAVPNRIEPSTSAESERYSLRKRKQVNYCNFVDAENDFSDEPLSYSDAISRPDKKMWIAAMKDEYKSLMTNGTWTLVDNNGQKVIPCKWIFKIKRDSEGRIGRYKARLVAKGFRQCYGVDYEETFSPVVRNSSLRSLFALAADMNLKMHHLDIDTAFLHGELDESVFMTQPEGFAVKGSESKVCKLNKSLYGLKQAARAWNKKLHRVLIDLGYKNLKSESCVYIFRNDNVLSILAVYVDYLIIFHNNIMEVERLRKGLTKYFGVKNLGSLCYCLGLHITSDEEKGEIRVNQKRYILETLRRFDMEDCKSVATPIEPGVNLHTLDEETINNVPYQNLIGCLMYLSVNTRPDISFAVSYLSQFNNSHSYTHWKAAKRILQYLKGTIDYGLTFKKASGDSLLSGFVDADWANGKDRKSYTGYVFKLSNGPVSWESRKQSTVALSTTEAEYMALSAAAKEAVYLQRFVGEICGNLGCITLYNDNQSTLKLANNPVYHNRTKHIDVRYHFIRELIDNNTINVSYLSSENMCADVLTKGLCRIKHLRCVKGLGLA